MAAAMIREKQLFASWSCKLFKLFRRKQDTADKSPDEGAAGGESGGAPVAVAEPAVELPAAEVDQYEPGTEYEAAEDEPAFDEDLEERTGRALTRTKRGFFRRMLGVFERSQIDDQLWDELEEILIGSDAGIDTTERVLDDVRRRVRKEGMKAPSEVREALREALIALLESVDQRGQLWGDEGSGESLTPAVILVIGVNGVGKTTSIAKLARAFRRDGERVILAAADTFRAAAIEQLKTWGERVGATVIAHQQGQDASAVVWDAMAAAKKRNADVVLIDTAGRLHTKSNLMEELKKISRIVQKNDPSAPHEVLLVLDGLTGQNGLMQAKTFAEAVGVTGIFLTKLDGTAKGGIVFAIADQLGIPVRFIGIGERADDIAPFDPESFVDALFALDGDAE
ncbi:MAG: signal recognition particle-docking protein FtsY [Dehalococcoidia bacterium]